MRQVAMMLMVPLAGVLAGCPVLPAPTPVDPIKIAEPRTGTGYWVYVPSYHTPDRDWPLVVTLHGSWGWDGAYRQVLEWKGLAEEQGFIVAAPALESAEGILPTTRKYEKLAEDERRVLTVIEDLQERYNTDPKAVMLSGFSAGGYPLYWIGLRNPEKFDMLVARACNCSIEHLEKIPITAATRALKIRIFWGKDDLDLIQKESWQGFGWLIRHGFANTEKQTISGGHMRRPEVAWQLWAPHLPARHRSR